MSAVAKFVGPVEHALFGRKKDSTPAAASAAAPETTRAADALREQREGQRAVGAGVVGSDNEVDSLGVVRTKRTGAARSILG